MRIVYYTLHIHISNIYYSQHFLDVKIIKTRPKAVMLLKIKDIFTFYNTKSNNNNNNSNEANVLTFVYLIWPLSSGNDGTECQEGRKLCN